MLVDWHESLCCIVAASKALATPPAIFLRHIFMARFGNIWDESVATKVVNFPHKPVAVIETAPQGHQLPSVAGRTECDKFGDVELLYFDPV